MCKGEHGTDIVFFKLLEREGEEGENSVTGTRAANDKPSRLVIPLLRSFTVFKAAEVEHLPASLTTPEATDLPDRSWSPCDAADELLHRAPVRCSFMAAAGPTTARHRT